MEVIIEKLVRTCSDGGYNFFCVGCKTAHHLSSAWEFNGDFDNPTFNPSIKVTYPANPDAIEEFKEWRTERICHSFIRNGKIEYCPDCFHDLAGQIVDMVRF